MTDKRTINLGRIRPVSRGSWLVTNSYAFLDFVTYLGCTYLCNNATGSPIGTYPTDEAYWVLVASKGIDASWTAATLAEVNTAANNTKPITPLSLAKAKVGGVATLNSSGKVPLAQLPMATNAEITEGTSEIVFVNPKQLKSYLRGTTEIFTTSQVWTCPAGVTDVTLEGIGGGKAPYHGNYMKGVHCAVVPGTDYNIVIGNAPDGATSFGAFFSTLNASDALAIYTGANGTDGLDSTDIYVSAAGGTGGKGYGAGGGEGGEGRYSSSVNSASSMPQGGRAGQGGMIINGTLAPVATDGAVGQNNVGFTRIPGVNGTGCSGVLIIRY